MLSKKYSLKGKANFSKAYRLGKRSRRDIFGLVVIKNNLNHNRYGIVISQKKVAKANKRNLIRRIVKRTIKQKHDQIRSPYDYVFTVLKRLEDIPKSEIEKEVLFLLELK